MEVVLYKFSKKYNSTALPPGEGVVYDITLKRDCSVVNPVILVNWGVETAALEINYVYIPDFKRYYYITEYTYRDALWELALTEDYLASWRDYIGNANLYLLRAARAFDLTITDNTYPMTSQITYGLISDTAPWQDGTGDLTHGCYIIGIVSSSSENGGGVITYYGMDELQFRNFSKILFDSSSWLNINWNDLIGFNEQLLKPFFNPAQYIVSCTWYPFTVVQQGFKLLFEFKIGWWLIGASAYVFDRKVVQYHVGTYDFPRHPQAGQRGAYLDYQPYSFYQFYAAPFGLIELNRADFAQDVVRVELLVDFTTGLGRLLFYNDISRQIVKYVDTQFGVPQSLATVTTDMISGVTQGFNTAMSVGAGLEQLIRGTGEGIVSAIGNLPSGVVNSAAAAAPTVQIISTAGTRADFARNTIFLISRHTLICPENLEELGRPLCDTRRVASLGGYMLPREVDFPVPCSSSEMESIRQIMGGGFYYE